MIEQFIEKLIEELGATGLLVIGLYFILYKPLNSMAKHIAIMNGELGEIVAIMQGIKKRAQGDCND